MSHHHEIKIANPGTREALNESGAAPELHWADTGTRNTSTGDPRGVELRLTNPHEYYVNFSILMNQRRGLLNEANASLILTGFSVLH